MSRVLVSTLLLYAKFLDIEGQNLSTKPSATCYRLQQLLPSKIIISV